jgi:hypothetical protein
MEKLNVGIIYIVITFDCCACTVDEKSTPGSTILLLRVTERYAD